MKGIIFGFILVSVFSLSNCNEEKKNNVETKIDFSKGSGIVSIKLNSQKIENLALLGKVWGFLKYYHPAVAEGKYNWDYELFKVLPQIISCKNLNERNTILSVWLENLGTVEKGTPPIIDSTNVKCLPDLNWIMETSKLGDILSEKLIDIYNAKRRDVNYYVCLERLGHPSFTNEDSYRQFSYPDTGFRLLCLFRYWNIIEYFYPYKYLIEEKWNNVLTEFIPKFINDSNELDYKLTVWEMTARIHDSHAITGSDSDTVWMNYRGNYLAPIKISFIENKAVVTGFYNEELGKTPELIIGDIILKIKNKSTDDFVKENLPFAHASNYPTQLEKISPILLRSKDSLLSITFQRGNATKSINIRCYSLYYQSIFPNHPHTDTCFKWLSPNIGYIFPETFKNKYSKSLMREILNTKGLVIDYRCYPFESNFFTFSNYFLPKSIEYAKCSSTNIASPGLFTFSSSFNVGFDNPQYYKGKLVIIVNEKTLSRAEWDVMAFSCAPNATVIGSTTAGADGIVSEINLIGGIKTHISGIGVYYPDGRETQRVGIIPDIEVHPTIKGIREGRDELLEKAIEIINGDSQQKNNLHKN